MVNAELGPTWREKKNKAFTLLINVNVIVYNRKNELDLVLFYIQLAKK